MRYDIIGPGIEITYPNEVCFAFNRNVVTLRCVREFAYFYIEGFSEAGISESGYSDERKPSNDGIVEIDISEYLRMLFNIGDGLVNSKRVEVEVTADREVYVFSMSVIWGAINIGETFNGSRKVTCFRKFPQTVSFYVSYNDKVYIEESGMPERQLTVEAWFRKDAVNHLNLKTPDLFVSPTAPTYAAIKFGNDGSRSTFTYEFDVTFKPLVGFSVIEITFDDSECGLYLRWIDRHGFYQYYLFAEGDNSFKTGDVGEDMRISPENLPASIHSYGMVRNQGKTMQETIKACALCLDKETFDMVKTIAASPLVHLYVDGEWVPVKIVAGTYTQTDEVLQDFEIQIQMPGKDLQRI